MTQPDEQERHDRWKALGIRTDIPHPARVYDYLLGGKDNYQADRLAAEEIIAISPNVLPTVRANRAFLRRAVQYLAGEAGYRACEQAVMTHGGFGYAKEFHVERYLREVLIPRIAPISPQLILSFIAEKVLGLPKSY